MQKYLAALLLAISCTVIADDSPPETKIPDRCGNWAQLKIAVDHFDELPFVMGNMLRNTPRGRVETSIFIFVNAEKGTWTLVEKVANDLYCILAVGTHFSPVSAQSIDNLIKDRQRRKI